MSSSCASLKSVVTWGCVSAAPSRMGCDAMESAPSARTRRLSFSMPRRRPLSVDAESAPTPAASSRAWGMTIRWEADVSRAFYSFGRRAGPPSWGEPPDSGGRAGLRPLRARHPAQERKRAPLPLTHRLRAFGADDVVQHAVAPSCEHDGIYVRLAAHGRGVSQHRRHVLHCRHDASVERALAHPFRQRRPSHDVDCRECRAPRAEVLRRERGAGHVLEILVHLARVDRVHRAVVHVLEQSLARQLMATADDAGEPLVVDDDLVHDAALRAKLELEATRAQEAD